MHYRQLGQSGLKVSVLALGALGFGRRSRYGDTGVTSIEAAREQVDACLDAGGNLIDTADVYSAGESEEFVGEVLCGRRERVLLATKVRFPTVASPGPNDSGLSRHHVARACEASLRRLRTDYIDLYQLHEWDGLTLLEETLEALDLLVRSGKVRYVGVSNFSAWHLMKALGIAERERLPRFVSQQIYYSLLAREAEYELVPLSMDQGIGILVWSPLARGLLSGQYRRDQAPTDGSTSLRDWREPPISDVEKLYDIVDVLRDIAAAHDVTSAQVALSYTLGKPGVTSLVVGARTIEHLKQNLAVANLELDEADRRRLDAVSQLPLLYPYWHQAMNAADRLSAADLSLLSSYINPGQP